MRAMRTRFILFAAMVAVAGAACAVAAAAAGSTWQDRWGLDVQLAMDTIGVAEGQVVGEAGAGDGYFTLPMARRVGASGAVYANDIDASALRRLADSAARGRLSNVHVVEGGTSDPRFPRKDLGLVVIVHAFHDFDRPVEWLVNCKGYLRAGARVAVVDDDPAQGAPSHFWPRERIIDLARQAGYEPVQVVEVPKRHVIVILRVGEERGAAAAPLSFGRQPETLRLPRM